MNVLIRLLRGLGLAPTRREEDEVKEMEEETKFFQSQAEVSTQRLDQAIKEYREQNQATNREVARHLENS